MLKVFILVVTIASISEGKIFSRCGLVQELRRQGFPEDKMKDWVCLIENESSRDTSKINKNSNGSRDHGLFQFNDRYWCSDSNTAGKDCKVTCAEVRTDDITKASTCAKLVYQRHKFDKWNAWKDKCQKDLPNISNC